MKKILITGIMVLFSFAGIFAQNWTVNGYIGFRNGGWDNNPSDTTTTITLTVGYYIAEDLNIGLYGSYSKEANGSSFEIGQSVKYDFLKFDRIYFSLFGNLYYGQYLDSYQWDEYYRDATYVSVALRPAVFFAVSKNIEVYWRFAELLYGIIWVDNGRTYNGFNLSGPFGNPTFGLVFRF